MRNRWPFWRKYLKIYVGNYDNSILIIVSLYFVIKGQIDIIFNGNSFVRIGHAFVDLQRSR